jgi:vancomycin aglycone glucosyltransferase
MEREGQSDLDLDEAGPAPGAAWAPGGNAATNAQRWDESVRAWNTRALERVNHNRSRLGQAPIDDVLRFNVTDHPWLAADAILAPAPHAPGMEVFQTGAWMLEDATPLSQGWAELRLIDQARDCIAVGDVNQQALFPRVAAVVHHGGAGTTATAARAGVPQVVVPLFGDQFYWASRVRALDMGSSLVGALTAESLVTALREVLEGAAAPRASNIARQLTSDGATVAARRLVAL